MNELLPTAEFNLEQAIQLVNQLVNQKINRNLTDIETTILTGSWYREEYEFIAVKHNYSTSYISQDVAPRLWKLLTEVLDEKVRKNNFREALKRHWLQKASRYKQYLSNSQTSGKDSEFSVSRSNKSPIFDLYVEHAAIETICCQALSQPGGVLRLKGYRLSGKTLLMNRISSRMSKEGYIVANLSLKLADKAIHLRNSNKFLRWFCTYLSQELKIHNQLYKYWDEEELGAKVSCNLYLQEYLLTTIDRPLLLCLDDIDSLLSYPEIYEAFFALLHAWYEKARTCSNWKNLRLIIVHATDIDYIYQFSFNFELVQHLPEFTITQTQELAGRYRLRLSEVDIQSLVSLVGGHPYLLKQAFNVLNSDQQVTMQELLVKASTEFGIYRNHLSECWLKLEQHSELAVSLKKLVFSDCPLLLDPIQACQLQNIGLIRFFGNQAEPRCNLYRQFFREHLK
jgi:hypothetical protein